MPKKQYEDLTIKEIFEMGFRVKLVKFIEGDENEAKRIVENFKCDTEFSHDLTVRNSVCVIGQDENENGKEKFEVNVFADKVKKS